MQKIKVTVFIFIAVICFAVLMLNTNKVQNKSEIYEYLIKEEAGTVTLYKQNVPQKQLDIPFDTLPEYDRNMLKKGIYFNNIEDVYKIIEDFDG